MYELFKESGTCPKCYHSMIQMDQQDYVCKCCEIYFFSSPINGQIYFYQEKEGYTAIEEDENNYSIRRSSDILPVIMKGNINQNTCLIKIFEKFLNNKAFL